MEKISKKIRIIDKDYCCSSFLALRYIEKENVDFAKNLNHFHYKLPSKDTYSRIYNVQDLDCELNRIFNNVSSKKLGILLSGGMDSACLAAYMPLGSDAYTFRFMGGLYDSDELKRAELFASKYNLNLHYVDIDFDVIKSCLYDVMKHKGAPVHSIEPQLYVAAKQAKEDGIELLIYGDAADYVFYGMDGLLSKDWTLDEFYKRVIYVDPNSILKNSSDLMYLFNRYRLQNNKIDFLKFYDEVITEESYGSYYNAFKSAGIDFLDPYEKMIMGNPVDLSRIRNGESKYIIRELFKLKYPDLNIPEKHPMPRPVDLYFKDYVPTHSIFKENVEINKYTGNQKWLMWCLEEFLRLFVDKKEC